ncbi:MAG: hypothetical protein R3C18_18380 [Planctomycetaceae bacterium]
MAASSNKPTAVHFALAFFVTTTLILAVVCYLNAKELSKVTADANTARDEATKNKNEFDKLFDEVDSLRRVLGYQGPIGAPTDNPEQSEAGTIQKQLHTDLNLHGRSLVQPSPTTPSVAETLLAMRTELDSKIAEVGQLQSSVTNAESRLQQETESHRQERSKIQASQMDSEKQRQDKVLEQNEILTAKDDEIEKLANQYRQTLVEKEQIGDELKRVRKEKDEEIAQLVERVVFLTNRLAKIENISFEIPDGEVVRVISGSNGKVWINLGELDGLRRQTSFSVYVSNHDGMARENRDVKAKIEVIEVLEDHLSVARIIWEDESRPIKDGDPIYTPLWTAGQKEYFAFVGGIDINGDGKSDRELLRGLLANVGAVIDLEIDDHGERVPADGQMSVRTKFLVLGDIPDPVDVPSFETERRAEIAKIQAEYKDLEEQALRTGIRVVHLSDFLTWAGISPQERLFLPGDERGFVLKSGAHSQGVGEEVGSSRLSSGQVSDFYNKRSTGQKVSEGQNSAIFGGGTR